MSTAVRRNIHAPTLRLIPSRRMSESDFIAWCDEDTHAEWVNGKVIVMSPENVAHKHLVFFLLHLIDGYVTHKNLGTVAGEAVHVRLPGQSSRRSPDLFFVSKARKNLIKEQYIDGAPDLIVEVVSPESVSRDYREKFREYESAGVHEYWIIDPANETLEAHRLDKHGNYKPIPLTQGKVRSSVLKGFYLKPEWLWRNPRPNWLKLLSELGVR